MQTPMSKPSSTNDFHPQRAYLQLVQDTLRYLSACKKQEPGPLPPKKRPFLRPSLHRPTENPRPIATAVQVKDSKPTEEKASPPSVKKEEKRPFSLTSPAPITYPIHSVRELLKKTAHPFSWGLPDDSVAKQTLQMDRHPFPAIALLATQSHPYLSLLCNIASALNAVFASARVLYIEKFKAHGDFERLLTTPHLKWVIAPDQLLWNTPLLLPFLKEYPQAQEKYLSQTPLLLLPNLHLYAEQPLLKRSLWQLINRKFNSISQKAEARSSF